MAISFTPGIADQSLEQKAAEYNRLFGQGFTDADIRAAADATFGTQSASDWAALTNLANPLALPTAAQIANTPGTGAQGIGMDFSGFGLPATNYNTGALDLAASTNAGNAAANNVLGGVILAGDSWLSNPTNADIIGSQIGQGVTNVAVGGSTTADTLNQLNSFIDSGGSFAPGSTVMLNLGGNDLLQGLDQSTVRNNLNQIVSTLGNLGVNVVLSGASNVGSVADVTGSTDLAMSDIYNDVAVNNRNVTLVDAMSDLLNQKNLVTEDGFHLNDAGRTAFNAALSNAYLQSQGLDAIQFSDQAIRDFVVANGLTPEQAVALAPSFGLTGDRVLGALAATSGATATDAAVGVADSALPTAYTPTEFHSLLQNNGATDSQATATGLKLLNDAGYSPQEAVDLWNATYGTNFTADDYNRALINYGLVKAANTQLAVFGDSISSVVGYNQDASADTSQGLNLAQYLGQDLRLTATNNAIGGQTSSDALNGTSIPFAGTEIPIGYGSFGSYLSNNNPEVAVLRFGAADAIRLNNPELSISNIEQMVQMSLANGTRPILVGVTPFAKQGDFKAGNIESGITDSMIQSADAINDGIKNLAKKYGVQFVDVRSVEVPKGGLLDGVHPSGEYGAALDKHIADQIKLGQAAPREETININTGATVNDTSLNATRGALDTVAGTEAVTSTGAIAAAADTNAWDYNKFYENMSKGSTDTEYLSSLLNPLSTQAPDLANNARNIFNEIINQQTVTGDAWGTGRLGSKEAAALDYSLRLAEAGVTSLNDIKKESYIETGPEGGEGVRSLLVNSKTGAVIGSDGAFTHSSGGGNRLGYALEVTDNGIVVPYTVSRKSGWVNFREGTLKPALSLMGSFIPGAAPFIAAGNAINAANKGDWGTAVVSALTAVPGFNSTLNLSPETLSSLNTAKTAGQVLNAIDKDNPVALANTLMQTGAGKELMQQDMGGGITLGDVLNTAKTAQLVRTGNYAEALSSASEMTKSPNLQVAASAVNLIDAFASENPFRIINAVTQLGRDVKNTDTTTRSTTTGALPTANNVTSASGATDTVVSGGAGAGAGAGASDAQGVVINPIDAGGPNTSITTTAATGAEDAEWGDLAGAQRAATARNTVSIGNTEATSVDEAAALARRRDPSATNFTFDGATYSFFANDAQVRAAQLEGQISSAPSRSEAFRIARQGGLGANDTFTWNGKVYSAATAEERPDLAGKPAATVTGAGAGRGSYAGYDASLDTKANITPGTFTDGPPKSGPTVLGVPIGTVDDSLRTIGRMGTVVMDFSRGIGEGGGNFLQFLGDLGHIVSTSIAGGNPADAAITKDNLLKNAGSRISNAYKNLTSEESNRQWQDFTNDVKNAPEHLKPFVAVGSAFKNFGGVINKVGTEVGEDIAPVLTGLGVGSKFLQLGTTGTARTVAASTTLGDMSESLTSSYNSVMDQLKGRTDMTPEEKHWKATQAGAGSMALTAVFGYGANSYLAKSLVGDMVGGPAKKILGSAGIEYATEFPESFLQKLNDDYAATGMITAKNLQDATSDASISALIGAKSSGSLVGSVTVLGQVTNEFVGAEKGPGGLAVVRDAQGNIGYAPARGLKVGETLDASQVDILQTPNEIIDQFDFSNDQREQLLSSIQNSGGVVVSNSRSTVQESMASGVDPADAIIDVITQSTTSSNNAAAAIRGAVSGAINAGASPEVAANAALQAASELGVNSEQANNAVAKALSNANVDPAVAATLVVDPAVNPAIDTAVDPNVAPTVDTAVDPNVNPAIDTAVDPNVNPAVDTAVAPTVNPLSTVTQPTITGTPDFNVVDAGVLPVDTTPADAVVAPPPVIPGEPAAPGTPMVPGATETPTTTQAPKAPGTQTKPVGALLAYAAPGSTGGALPGNLTGTMLAAGQRPEIKIMQDLQQLYPQLANIDPQLLSILAGKSAPQTAANLKKPEPATQAPAPEEQAKTKDEKPKSPLAAAVPTGSDALMSAGLKMLNSGNLAGFAKGGTTSGALPVSQHVPEFITGKTGNYVQGAGDGQSDDIPAMLADGEYVFDADIVSALGNGSNKAGARILDKMREEIRKHKRSAPPGKIPPPAKSPLEYMKG